MIAILPSVLLLPGARYVQQYVDQTRQPTVCPRILPYPLFSWLSPDMVNAKRSYETIMWVMNNLMKQS